MYNPLENLSLVEKTSERIIEVIRKPEKKKSTKNSFFLIIKKKNKNVEKTSKVINLAEGKKSKKKPLKKVKLKSSVLSQKLELIQEEIIESKPPI